MRLTGNTILITGGGSGIGLGLAEQFAKLDNQVIIAGRSKSKLTEAKQKGFATFPVDMTSVESIQSLAKEVIRTYPRLNVVIQNAGVMKPEDLLSGGNTSVREETISTNLLGPMRLNEALLPHFLKQDYAAIMTVTSGLAFLPLALAPTYCATKAAIHSYTESLRYQLQDTSIEVIELPPPYVQTHLGGEYQANDPMAMPLKDFITEVMQILKDQPKAKEILVGKVLGLRFAADGGKEKYDTAFKSYNDMITASRTAK